MEEELELDVNQTKSSKTSIILIIVLAVLVINIGGIDAWYFLVKDDASSASAKKEKSAETEEKAKNDLGPLKYLTLVPEFIVNFGPGSKVRYLQVDLQIATRDEAALKTVATYRPVLRNDILVILSGLSFEQLQGRSGKEALQKNILNTINKVIISSTNVASHEGNEESESSKAGVEDATKDEVIDGPIENVYFTSFIMQ